jgi:hypothetical protein
MTVNSEIQKNIANGNDAATVFSFTFTVFNTDDIEVYVKDAGNNITQILEGTGANKYSVTLTSANDLPSTGSVTYPEDEVVPLPTGDKIVVVRKLTLGQETDLVNQGPFNPETLENQLDKLTMMIIQLQEQLDRAAFDLDIFDA